MRLRFWRLPSPPARLPFALRRAWLALAIWRGWPDPWRGYRTGEPIPGDYDPFADIDARLAWGVAGGLEGGAR